MKQFTLFILFISLLACKSNTKSNSNDQDELVKEFLKENELDKRTTLFEVELKDAIAKGKVESQALKDKFIHFLEQQDVDVIDSLIVIERYKNAYIRNSVANVRSNPKHSAELSTQYLLGQPVNIIEEKDGWFYIQGPDNYLGWVDAGGIILKENVSDNYVNAEKVSVQVNEVQAYETAAQQTICCDLVFGNQLGKIGDNQYVLPDGKTIYLANKYVSKPSSNNKVDLVLEKANSLLGRPYLWGGTSTKGMDCSGFTRTAFMNADYMLGRDASLQVHEGIEIDKDDISKWLPGDLLFFGTIREDGSQRITHVAIHQQNGDIIHSAGWVKEESLHPESPLYNEDRANTLLRVKRIF